MTQDSVFTLRLRTQEYCADDATYERRFSPTPGDL